MHNIVKDLKLTGQSYQVVKQRTRDNLEAKRRDLGVKHLDLLPEAVQQEKLFNHYKHYNTNYSQIMDTVCRHSNWNYAEIKAMVAGLYRQLCEPHFAGPAFKPAALQSYRRCLQKVRDMVAHEPCIR